MPVLVWNSVQHLDNREAGLTIAEELDQGFLDLSVFESEARFLEVHHVHCELVLLLLDGIVQVVGV
jgi:hypothetical protein